MEKIKLQKTIMINTGSLLVHADSVQRWDTDSSIPWYNRIDLYKDDRYIGYLVLNGNLRLVCNGSNFRAYELI